jgi:hypothetical protein
LDVYYLKKRKTFKHSLEFLDLKLLFSKF